MAGQYDAPHILSNDAERYVASTTSEAIFFIRARAADDVRPYQEGRDALSHLLRIPVSSKGKRKRDEASSSKKPEPADQVDDSWHEGDIYTATGFAARRQDGLMIILTAAHIIKQVYAHRPVITNDCRLLNTAIFFDVLCIHQERNLLHADPPQSFGAIPRRFTRATVLAIDSQLDLLALQIQEDQIQIYAYPTHVQVPCPHNHGVIPIAERTSPDSERVLFQSWPNLRCDSTYWTKSSYAERRYDTLTSLNPYHYGMKLLEIPGLNCPKGCSGGPIVNGLMCAVGLYHGVINGYGYAVSLRDIRNFMQRYHLLEGPMPAVPP